MASAMKNIYSIVTHHEEPEAAAKAWKRENVCAIGWAQYGDLRRKPRESLDAHAVIARDLFGEMKRGDLVLAYSTGNTIALVGEVTSGWFRNEKNEVGAKGEFEYANQRRVKWWSEPRDFNRWELPRWFALQLGKRGQTIVRLDFHGYGFDKVVEIIRACARSGSALEAIEDLVKAGIRKYLGQEIDALEDGLQIISAEKSITKEDRPDFVAKDVKGTPVLIECKGQAGEADCDQLRRYGIDFKHPKKTARLMLVAFGFDPTSRKVARKYGIEMIECRLNFARI
jgi:hypothetical protein